MARHKPGITWMLRKFSKYPNGQVSTASEKDLIVSIYPEPGKGYGFTIDRRTARQLAKRINQCLDDTK